jgi:hypothetical protein
VWILIGVILQVGPAAAPPLMIREPTAGAQEGAAAKNDLEAQYMRNPAGYRVMITCVAAAPGASH